MIDYSGGLHYKKNMFSPAQFAAPHLTNPMDSLIDQSWAAFDSLRAPEPVAEFTKDFLYYCECGGFKVAGLGMDMPVCTGCGRVDSTNISDEPEWRSGGDECGGDPSRVGAPVNLDHFSAAWGANTVMHVSRNASYATRRLARINLHTSMNHKDRALFHSYAELDRIGKTILSLPDNVMYQVKIKYKAFSEAVLTRGAVRNGIKANCVFQACKEFNVSRTTREIAAAFGIHTRDLSRTFDMYQAQVPDTSVRITGPADLVARIFNDVSGIPDGERGRVKMTIVKECNALEDCVELMGRTPKAIVAAVMLKVLTQGGYSPDKAQICKICNVSAPTLTKIEVIINSRILVS